MTVSFKFTSLFSLVILIQVRSVQATCQAPGHIQNGRLADGKQCSGDKFEEGQEILYVCESGYSVIPGPISVCRHGQWTSVRCIRMCSVTSRTGTRFMKDDTEVKAGTKVQNGTNLYKVCEEGYESRDTDGSVVCDAGTLRGDDACTPTRCALVQSPDSYTVNNGLIRDGMVDHGSRVSKRCRINHEFSQVDIRNEVKYDLLCVHGYMTGCFPTCIPKRCTIPPERQATGNRPYSSLELVKHGEIVQLNFRLTEELYFPENKAYSERFTSTCRYGQWSRAVFPIYKPRRCTIQRRANTVFKQNGMKVRPNTKVKDGTILKKVCDKGYEDTYRLRQAICNKGTLVGDDPCTAAKCELLSYHSKYTDVEGNIRFRTIEHGGVITQTCHDNYEFEKENIRYKSDRNATCANGKIDLEMCVTKRCMMPKDRNATGDQFYPSGDLVKHNETVYTTCDCADELYFPDNRTYADVERFSSNCTYGNWSEPNFPVCKNKRCEIPERNGTRFTKDNKVENIGSKVENGTILEKVCEEGYENMDNKSRVECDRGTLHNDAACTPKRCEIPKRNGTRFVKDKAEVKDGTKVENGTNLTKECKDGFENRDKDDSVVCDMGKLLRDAACTPKRCKIPERNGTRFTKDNKVENIGSKVENGTILEKVCEEGYENMDNKSRVECDRGTLHNDAACTPKRCEIPKRNGTRFVKDKEDIKAGTKVENGTNLTKECEDGFENRDKDDSVVCDMGKLLQDNACTPKQCKIPKRDGTRFMKDKTEVKAGTKVENGTNLTKECEDGFENRDKDDSVVCDMGKLLRDAACTPKRCKIPKRDRTRFMKDEAEVKAGTKVENGTNLTKECEDGFENRDKDDSVVCDMGKLLRDAACTPKQCTIPSYAGTSFMKKKRRVVPGEKINHNTRLNKVCDEGYEDTSNEPIVVCDKGKLRGDDPCTLKTTTTTAKTRTTKKKERERDKDNNDNGENNGGSNNSGGGGGGGGGGFFGFLSSALGALFAGLSGLSGAAGSALATATSTFALGIGPFIGVLPLSLDRKVLEKEDKQKHLSDSEARCVIPQYAGTLFVEDFERVTPATNVKEGTVLVKVCKNNFVPRSDIYAVCYRGVLHGSEECVPSDDYNDYDYGDYDGEDRCTIPDHKATRFIQRSVQITPGTKVKDGSTFVKLCDEGYILDPQDRFAVCDKGTLHGDDKCQQSKKSIDNFPDYPEYGVYDEEEPECTIPSREGTMFVHKFEERVPGTLVGDKAILAKVCKEGYEIISNETVAVCDKGVLRGDEPCTLNRCTIPDHKATRFIQRSVQITPGTKVKDGSTFVKLCDEGYILDPQDRFAVCDKGTLHGDDKCQQSKKSIDNLPDYPEYGVYDEEEPECTIPSREGTMFVHKFEERVPGTLVGDKAILAKVCKEGYEIISNETVAVCDKGVLRGDEPCTLNRCTIPDHKATRFIQRSVQITPGTKVKDGSTFVKLCDEGYILDPQDRFAVCDKGTLHGDDKCQQSKKSIDNFPDYPEYGVYDEEEPECTIPSREGTMFVHKFEERVPGTLVGDKAILAKVCKEGYEIISNETVAVCDKGVLRGDEPCTLSIDYEDDYGSYDNSSDDYIYHIPINGRPCRAPEHGMLQRHHFIHYIVTCEKGYSLNTVERDPRFECEKGELFSVDYKTSPLCIENSCILSTDMHRKMEIYDRKRGTRTKRIFSEDYPFRPGVKLFFKCKQDYHEPIHRRFQCHKGDWIADDRDRQWTMTINSSDPSCRPVKCNPDCAFGGTCISDDKCEYKPGKQWREY